MSIRDTLRRLVGRRRMDDRAALFDFWRQPSPEGNDPSAYIEPTGRSRALAQLLADVPKSARILEVGCNVGRNLAHLHAKGWRSVEGVEINPHAVELLRQTYPELASNAVHLGPAEEVLPRLQPVDVLFTMAVLEHIHPSSTVVFDNIARLAPIVLTIEPERGNSSHRQFPHDLRALFGRRGFRLTSEQSMEQLIRDPALAGYSACRWERV